MNMKQSVISVFLVCVVLKLKGADGEVVETIQMDSKYTCKYQQSRTFFSSLDVFLLKPLTAHSAHYIDCRLKFKSALKKSVCVTMTDFTQASGSCPYELTTYSEAYRFSKKFDCAALGQEPFHYCSRGSRLIVDMKRRPQGHSLAHDFSLYVAEEDNVQYGSLVTKRRYQYGRDCATYGTATSCLYGLVCTRWRSASTCKCPEDTFWSTDGICKAKIPFGSSCSKANPSRGQQPCMSDLDCISVKSSLTCDCPVDYNWYDESSMCRSKYTNYEFDDEVVVEKGPLSVATIIGGIVGGLFFLICVVICCRCACNEKSEKPSNEDTEREEPIDQPLVVHPTVTFDPRPSPSTETPHLDPTAGRSQAEVHTSSASGYPHSYNSNVLDVSQIDLQIPSMPPPSYEEVMKAPSPPEPSAPPLYEKCSEYYSKS